MRDEELESLAREVDDEEPETNGARTVLRAVALAVLFFFAFILFCLLTAPIAKGQLICDPPDACEPEVCALPMRCVDVTTLTCGTPAPVSCADFESSLTKIFVDSEAPAIGPGLVARLRYARDKWRAGQKLDASRIKVVTDLVAWVESYLVFKDFQPHTPSTGQTVVGYREAPAAKPDLELAAAIEAIDKEEQ